MKIAHARRFENGAILPIQLLREQCPGFIWNVSRFRLQLPAASLATMALSVPLLSIIAMPKLRTQLTVGSPESKIRFKPSMVAVISRFAARLEPS